MGGLGRGEQWLRMGRDGDRQVDDGDEWRVNDIIVSTAAVNRRSVI